MDNKRFLKVFESQSAYESQKDEVMGMPHVVLLDDTKEIVFASNQKSDNIITFSIVNIEYQAEEGMTWGAWVESQYNTDGFYLYDNEFIRNNEGLNVGVEVDDTIGEVYPTTVIIRDFKYIFVEEA